MSGKSRRRSSQKAADAQSSKTLVMAIAAVGLMIIAAAVVMLLQGGGDSTDDFVPEVSGAPRLAVLSDTLIDHGDLQPNQFVDSVFRVKNVGDQPLTLACDDRVQLLEGC